MWWVKNDGSFEVYGHESKISQNICGFLPGCSTAQVPALLSTSRHQTDTPQQVGLGEEGSSVRRGGRWGSVRE